MTTPRYLDELLGKRILVEGVEKASSGAVDFRGSTLLAVTAEEIPGAAGESPTIRLTFVVEPAAAGDATALRGIPLDEAIAAAGEPQDGHAITFNHAENKFELTEGGTGPQGPEGPEGPEGPTGPTGPAPTPVANSVYGSDGATVDLTTTPRVTTLSLGAGGDPALLERNDTDGLRIGAEVNGGVELWENDIRVWRRSQAVEEGHYHGGIITSIVASERVTVDLDAAVDTEMLRVALPLLYDEEQHHWDVTVSAVFTGAAGRFILRRTFTVRGDDGSPVYDDDDLGGLVTVEAEARPNWDPPDLYLDGDEWVAHSPIWTDTPVAVDAFHRVEVAVIIDRLGEAPLAS